MAIPVKKRIRAKRARSHWRERGHDLRARYREADLPSTANIAVTLIEDAYAPVGRVDKDGILHAEAELEPVRHADGTLSLGAPAWTPPQRPLSKVVRNLREDPLGRMHARRQISEPQYRAARGYQELFERATLGRLSPADPGRVKVDGGRFPDPISPGRMAAAKRLRSVEGTVKEWHGFAGLSLIRSVLTGGKSVAMVARDLGATSDRAMRQWSWLFRLCLDQLVKALGLSNTTRRPPRPARLNGGSGIPDTADPSLHADASELADPALRRGRSNGHGQ